MVESAEAEDKIRRECGGVLLATERASEDLLASKLPARVLMASQLPKDGVPVNVQRAGRYYRTVAAPVSIESYARAGSVHVRSGRRLCHSVACSNA